MTTEQIIEIIRSHRKQCERKMAEFNFNLSQRMMMHVPLQTIQRKQYTYVANIELLDNIIQEIENGNH